MHIVLVSHYSLPHLGGIQFVIGQLWERLASRGHQVTIVACDTGIPRGVYREGTKTRIGLPALNVLEDYSIPFPLFNPLVLRKTLSDTLATADAVHIHGMLYMSSVMAARMARKRDIPVILTEHVGMIPFNNVLLDSLQKLAFYTLGRSCCRNSDAVTVLNRRVASEIRPLVPLETQITRVTNGVDIDLFRPASPEERRSLREKWGFKRPAVLFVGRFVRKKGIGLLLEAVADDFDLILCGAGAMTFDHPRVRVLGLVGQQTLSEIYRAADVLVLPSEGEGFPLTVQEAMACGLPVIVTDNEVNHEYLDGTVAVFTVRTPDAIRDSILRLLAEPERHHRMGKAGRQWAVKHFNWEQSVDRYIELYTKSGSVDA